MKAFITATLIFFPLLASAQENPCESDAYLRYQDTPSIELRGAAKLQKRKAEMACHRYKPNYGG